MYLRTVFLLCTSGLLTSVTAYGIDTRALSPDQPTRVAVDDVPTPLSDYKRDHVLTPSGIFKRDDVPTPMTNFKRDDVPTPLVDFKRDDAITQEADDDTFVPLNDFRLRRS